MRKTSVGGENFQKLFHDNIFWQSLAHNLWIFVVCGAVIIAAAVLIAHLMRGNSRSQRLLRSVYLFPQIVSMVIVAVMWQFILNPQGLLNSGLRAVGLESWTHTWLGESDWALRGVGAAFIWFALGFYIMLFAAGLEGIPAEINEAAELDGSRGWHRFRQVTWPLLWSVKRVAITYLLINVMNIFALVFLMTRGGPDEKSEVMLTYLYQKGFTSSQFGYATAIAVLNFVVVMAISLVILFIYRRNPTERRAA
jgi:N-acetylglucosamine transport system permease protein